MITKNNIEKRISTEQDISNAIRDFINELVATDYFKNYESTSEKFQNDQEAQKVLQQYQAKAKDLQTKQLLKTITSTEQQDLQMLWATFLAFKPVQEFFDAQAEFQTLCRACAQIISDKCGLDYATSCGSSCCG